MRRLLLAGLIAVLCIGWTRPLRRPDNVKVAATDTLYIGADSTYYTEAFYPSDGVDYCLLVEANDTSATGYSSDSACVDITLLAGFNIPVSAQSKKGDSVMVLLGSHAHPDSNEEAGDAWPFGTDFVVADSLHIASMDSAAIFVRTKFPITDVNGDTVNWYYSDQVDSVADRTDNDFGAYEYYYFNDKWMDFTPAVVLEVDGNLSNKVGSPSRWIFRWYQIKGVKQSD